ncbi:hypothetical protein niasHT_023774 [Heterodera trifolii]|uniref:Uncharacterized protein n=1 Tax=Heterodera trifolii TaxID=157864 RepID=A0ABD2JNR9_9BILA
MTQLGAILFNHSHLGGLSMFDTIFLLIAHADIAQVHKWMFVSHHHCISMADLVPFLRIISFIAYQVMSASEYQSSILDKMANTSDSKFALNWIMAFSHLLINPRPCCSSRSLMELKR